MRFADNSSIDYGAGVMYNFLEGGVLEIRHDDKTKWTEYYAPGRWAQVTADPNHKPGSTGDHSDIPTRLV